MKLGLRILAVPVIVLAAAGCQRPESSPAPAAAPPTLTSAPVPAAKPPHRQHVWRFDFVLTPKDPRDATLTPTTFSVNIPDHDGGEVTIGKNVPLQTTTTAMGTPRQDVGLKVKAHVQPFDTSDDLLVDIEMELSATETATPGSTIRKVSARGAAVAVPGKPSLLVSMEDDKRHYDLTVTTTKLR